MTLIKKRFGMLTAITAALLLGACGDKNESEQTVDESNYDNPRNHTAEDFMPISEGFEEYPVWIETNEDPVRDSLVQNIYVFNKEKVTVYNLHDENASSGVVIEDILDMSDDELIKFATKTSEKKYEDYEKEIEDRKLFNLESFNEAMKELNFHLEDYYGKDYRGAYEAYLKEQKPMIKDIQYSIEGERPVQSNKYTLNVKIDDLGQYTEGMELIIPNANFNLKTDGGSGSSLFGDYINFLYFDTDLIFSEMDNDTILKIREENYIEPLKKYGSFEEKDGYGLTHPQNFTLNSFVWEKSDKILSLDPMVVHQKIFDTTFSGIKKSNGSLLTRVDDSFVGFKLDGPDTDKKNVTIEGE